MTLNMTDNNIVWDDYNIQLVQLFITTNDAL